jgi:hypothetical protein
MRRTILSVTWKLAVVAGVWFLLTHRTAIPAGRLLGSVQGEAVSRGEVIAIARSYAEHRWQASAQNVRHGRDGSGVAVQTPDEPAGRAHPNRWQPGQENVGMPYKWGGFDTPASFDAGLLSAKAAGDLYSSAKRRAGNEAVSAEAVGIDCSGFISRCWKLPEKLGTANLPGVCRQLASADDLQPGDIMDIPHQHVLLFSHWLNGGKSSALFYEAEGDRFAKVVANERSLWELRLLGGKPLRYARIRD